jgi:hypothetical protein
MATSAGELREMLISSIEAVKTNRIDHQQAMSIAKLAAQVNESLKVELHAMELAKELGLKDFRPKALGQIALGEEQTEAARE